MDAITNERSNMENLKNYTMTEGYVAIMPKEIDDLQPELGKYAIRTNGKVIASSKMHEIGIEVIFDGTQGIKLEDSDIYVVPNKAVLAYKPKGAK